MTTNMENSNPHAKFGDNAIYCLGCRQRQNNHSCSFIIQRRVNTARQLQYIYICSLACTYKQLIFGKLYSKGPPWEWARKRQSAITFVCEEIHHKYKTKGFSFANRWIYLIHSKYMSFFKLISYRNYISDRLDKYHILFAKSSSLII